MYYNVTEKLSKQNTAIHNTPHSLLNLTLDIRSQKCFALAPPSLVFPIHGNMLKKELSDQLPGKLPCSHTCKSHQTRDPFTIPAELNVTPEIKYDNGEPGKRIERVFLVFFFCCRFKTGRRLITTARLYFSFSSLVNVTMRLITMFRAITVIEYNFRSYLFPVVIRLIRVTAK